MNRILVLAAFALLPTFACAGPKDDLIATDKAFSALSVAKGSNTAFLAYMADDVRIFGTGNESPIHGKAEAAKRFQTSGNGDPKLNVLSWVPDYAEVSGDGSLGYSDGHWLFEAAPDAKGQRLHLTGHYVTVWRKTGSGWKFISDIGTTDPKPAK
ncbi:MAG: nuclear transport factor 2 family protein [Rhizomicrobium sp.]